MYLNYMHLFHKTSSLEKLRQQGRLIYETDLGVMYNYCERPNYTRFIEFLFSCLLV